MNSALHAYWLGLRIAADDLRATEAQRLLDCHQNPPNKAVGCSTCKCLDLCNALNVADVVRKAGGSA